MSGRDDFARELTALVAAEPAQGHPADSRLAAYAAGELDEADADAVRHHLATCRRCTRTVLEATRFPDLTPVAGEPDAAGTEAAWAATRARLVEQGVLPKPGGATADAGGQAMDDRNVGGPVRFAEAAPEHRRRRGPLARPAVAWAVAAALALAVVGLGAWNARLAGRLAEPVANVPILDLSLTVTRSSGGQPVAVPADGAPVVVLLLAPESLPERPSYGAELVGPGGERLWGVTGLVPTEFDTFTLQVPSRRIPAGTSRLRLLALGADDGAAEGEPELLEEHELRKAL